MKAELTQSEIALIVGVHKSTISRELRRKQSCPCHPGDEVLQNGRRLYAGATRIRVAFPGWQRMKIS